MSLVLLGSNTGGGNHDYDISAGGPYDQIFITVAEFVPSVDGTAVAIEFSPDNFSTIRTTGNDIQGFLQSGTSGSGSLGTPRTIEPKPAGFGNDAAGESGQIRIVIAGHDKSFVTFYGAVSYGEDQFSNVEQEWLGGFVDPNGTETHTHVRLPFAAGDSAKTACYGLRRSGPVSSGWEFVDSLSFTNSASENIDLPPDGDDTVIYRLMCYMTPDTAFGTQIEMSTDGGSTYINAADAYYGAAMVGDSGFNGWGGGGWDYTNTVVVPMSGSNNPGAGLPVWWAMDFYNSQNASIRTIINTLSFTQNTATRLDYQPTSWGTVNIAAIHNNIRLTNVFTAVMTGELILYKFHQ